MREELVTYKTAKLAKEKGFDWDVLAYYQENSLLINELVIVELNSHYYCDMPKYNQLRNANENKLQNWYSAPTQSQLQRWLREEYKIRLFVIPGSGGKFNHVIHIWDKPNTVGEWTRIGNITSSHTYEEAFEKGLQKALKLIK